MSHMIQHHISVNHESSYLRVIQSDMKRVLFVDKFFFVRVLKNFFYFRHMVFCCIVVALHSIEEQIA